MINEFVITVDMNISLDTLTAQLQEKGIEIAAEIPVYDNGNVVHEYLLCQSDKVTGWTDHYEVIDCASDEQFINLTDFLEGQSNYYCWS